MSGDMLSRIKRRNQRPSVKRDTSLVQSSEKDQTVPSIPTLSLEEKSAPVQSAAAGAMAIESELAQLPKVSQRRNIRLEVAIEERLLSFCQENNITVETFLEACFVEAEQNTRFRTEIVIEANRRLKLRKQAGKLRRVLSQLRN